MAKSLHTGPRNRAISNQLRQVENDYAAAVTRVAQLRAQLDAVDAVLDRYASGGAVPVGELRSALAVAAVDA